MATPIAGAIAAYTNPTGRLTGTGPAVGGPSFGDVLEQTARETVGTLRKSEDMSAMAAVGRADLTDVVQAVTNAEVMLQTVTAVRDKVVTAYQEILRMPI